MQYKSEDEVEVIVSKSEPIFVAISEGLYLEVRKNGTAIFVKRYQLNDKRKQMKIGVYGEKDAGLMSYGDALIKSIQLTQQIKEGIDPKLEADRKTRQNIKTVNDIAERFIVKKAKNIDSAYILQSNYDKRIGPIIGHLPVERVSPLDIEEILDNVVAEGYPTVANKVLFLCKNIFKSAEKLGLIDKNPASPFSATEDAGGPEFSRETILSKGDIKKAFCVFDLHSTIVPLSTRIGYALLLMLGNRKMELFSAKWEDIKMDSQTFTLYADDTKTKSALVIPIPDLAMPMLRDLKLISNGSEYLFPARKRSSRGYISDDTTNHTLAHLFGKKVSKKPPGPNYFGQAGIEYFTVHDLRRTFRSLLAHVGVSDEIAEVCMNHAKKGTTKTYNRYRYFQERKEALNKLAELINPLINHKGIQ
ncbi:MULTISPECIES: tyrosine-type recombinase/integrase [unclassified Colwellia]|uniref:tyrosine-type recombinase/integrase n=1 Tax=unclassified Colwellia TaxID=196834 RepID=UPI0015F5D0AC|nr:MULTISPECIES: site-specific integrase [unclassified Colwellia]MBA6232177.1 tyrosine-type recombinase/integrase [Colwellia sp. MB02u-7]MBA6237125.1 tyrosine-type recombinase/integrase [Colwellia sp. MB02u-11]MBA6301611.1 tyrosine-type recombinase/integrase [Colwellia sp. MB3u-22]MBA6311497.1 tyrosine-type recombinase/integrase [Colwellia sp. MB3u-64]